MNLFDLLLVALAATAATGGYRLGLLARALSWTGSMLGLVLGARFLPTVVGAFDDRQPSSRMFLAIAVLLGAAFLGQALGLLAGARAQVALPAAGRPLDRAAGAAVGAAGVFVALWLLLPALSIVPGEMALQARSSAIARFVADHGPPPPDTLQALRRAVGGTAFPEVFDAFRPAPDPGPPPAASGIPPEVLDAALSAVVRIEGLACGRIQEGSGFLVEPDLVVTNAHVVAGEGRTSVITRRGRRADATVVHFDPSRDIALLRTRVGAAPLPVGRAEEGDVGAVLGHPGGGPLEVSPYSVSERVDAVGRDLYDRAGTRRQVLVLAADLAPGDSGGALLSPAGTVVGVAFAIAPDRSGTAYALDETELRAALSAPRPGRADTGPCLH